MRQVDSQKRLKWEDVDLKEKEVWVYSTKTLKHRHVKIPECAIPILRTVQREGIHSQGSNYAKRFRDFTNRAGVKWHSDIMRHTYATYYHAKFNDEKELIKQMGQFLPLRMAILAATCQLQLSERGFPQVYPVFFSQLYTDRFHLLVYLRFDKKSETLALLRNLLRGVGILRSLRR
jgi:hypothetical protein